MIHLIKMTLNLKDIPIIGNFEGKIISYETSMIVANATEFTSSAKPNMHK